MRIERCAIPGCFLLVPDVRKDARGSFIKYFNADFFAEHGMATRYAEEYITVSGPGVLRGMHFQMPPHDHAKLVRASRGEVVDAVVDLRIGSPAYGKHALFELSADRPAALYIPAGLAHGFCVPHGEAELVYHVTSVHAPSHDTGIRWDSAGVAWPSRQFIVSERDAALPSLQEFRSPFRFESHAPA